MTLPRTRNGFSYRVLGEPRPLLLTEAAEGIGLCHQGGFEKLAPHQRTSFASGVARLDMVGLRAFVAKARLSPLPLFTVDGRHVLAMVEGALRKGTLVALRDLGNQPGGQAEPSAQLRALARLVESGVVRLTGARGWRYRLVADADLQGLADRDSFEVVSHDDAVKVLGGLLQTSGSAPDLREKIAEARDRLAEDWWPPARPDGLVLLRRIVRVSATRPNAEPPVTPSQLKKLMAKDWIEIEVLHESGKPYTGRYRIELPDESATAGSFDQKGLFSDHHLDTGTCLLSLPDLKLRLDSEAPKPGAGDKKVTVCIKASNGADAPPAIVAAAGEVKLKAVPSQGTGRYRWRTRSGKITLTNPTSEVVTVKGRKLSSGAGETVELIFTPAGAKALAPIKHEIKVGGVAFIREASHAWGYDVYEPVRCKDKNSSAFTEKPSPSKDFISIKSGEVGKVKVEIKNFAPSDVFFASKDASVCVPKVSQPNAQPFVLEVVAKAKDWAETDLEARLGSATGTVLATVGVVVAKEATYRATLFRVKDSRSPSSALRIAATTPDVETYLNNAYKCGVAAWRLSGGSEIDVRYDTNSNGALDMEPGTTSAEVRAVIAGCVATGQRVVQVHELNWAFYLANDAATTDTVIKIKGYSALKFIGKSSYVIQDSAGHQKSVLVKKVDQATGRVTLSAAIGQAFKVSDGAALMFPLAGLSGDPIWVKDLGSATSLKNVIAHELGHSLGHLGDSCEINNLMYGGPDNNLGLRHRGIKLYYDRPAREEQWKKLPR